MNFSKIVRCLKDHLSLKFETSDHFNNYKIFYKVKGGDNDCPSDYIIFSVDAVADLINSCGDLSSIFTMRVMLVSNAKSSYNNIELLDFLICSLSSFEGLEVKTVSITDSIVSEVCTNLYTDLRVDFAVKTLSLEGCEE